MDMRVVCAWCGTTIVAGRSPPSHGICPECERTEGQKQEASQARPPEEGVHRTGRRVKPPLAPKTRVGRRSQPATSPD